ncbi:MAG: ABC transporter permease subunit [Clostridia bacterium]
MTKFKNVFVAEFSKLLNKKSLLTLFLIVLLLVILTTVAYEAIPEEFMSMLSPQEPYTSHEEAIASYQEKLNNITDNFLNSNEAYQLKAKIAYHKYALEHKITSGSYEIYDSSNMFLMSNTALGYMRFIINVVLSILTIYIIVKAGSTLLGEEKNGTLKLALMRPISRASLLTAKWLSLIAFSVIAVFLTLFVTAIYGMFRFELVSKSILLVLNASVVCMVNPIVVFLVEGLHNLVYLFAFIQLSFFISFLFKNKTAGTIIPLLLLFLGDLVSMLMSLMHLGVIDFMSNLNWISALGVNGPSYKNMNLISTTLITIAYLAIFTTGNYLIFNKKDIN